MADVSWRAGLAVLARPGLWPSAARLLPPGWWRRVPPRLSLPPDYVRFRVQTMYGDGRTGIEPDDLVAYLQWCRKMHHRAS